MFEIVFVLCKVLIIDIIIPFVRWSTSCQMNCMLNIK